MPETRLAPSVTLANSVEMPHLGLGTSPMGDKETERAVAAAIEAGYRLFDTAENYRNERGVGRGIRAAGIDRGELFVTTKFNRNWHGYDEVQAAYAGSVERLGLDYIDLLLIHWPNPSYDRYVDAWRGMIRLLEEVKVRAIGVSNFKPAHIARLIDVTGLAPHVNQVQLNPYVPRAAERAEHQAHGIVTETWSPIGRGRELLNERAIAGVARQHGKTPAQVVLRWHVQQGLIPIPKSSNPQRMRRTSTSSGSSSRLTRWRPSQRSTAAVKARRTPTAWVTEAPRGSGDLRGRRYSCGWEVWKVAGPSEAVWLSPAGAGRTWHHAERDAYRPPGWRSIGHIGGEPVTRISRTTSKPWRS
jgi:2,5-diketo-D-gluconate reductase A